jgi:hypothetical protein
MSLTGHKKSGTAVGVLTHPHGLVPLIRLHSRSTINMKILYIANKTVINISTYSLEEYGYPSVLPEDSIIEPGNKKPPDPVEFVIS